MAATHRPRNGYGHGTALMAPGYEIALCLEGLGLAASRWVSGACASRRRPASAP